MNLKPNESLLVGIATGALTYGVFQATVGASVADVKSNQPHNAIMQGGITQAALTSAAIVVGISALSKDATVFVIGGSIMAALTWQYKHANMVNPANGLVTMPPSAGTPVPSATVAATGS